MPFTYEYPRPMVTVDAVVLARDGRRLVVALIERGHEPFKGCWALPGGFIEMNERLVESTKRELEEETGIVAKWLAPGCFIGTPGRDPRGRTISGIYYTVFPEKPDVHAGDDAAKVAWFPIEALPQQAFDHSDALAQTLIEIEKDALTTPLVFSALPKAFHARDFADACAAIPGLAPVEPHAERALHVLRERGHLSEIDDPNAPEPLFRFNPVTWGKAIRPWTQWLGPLD